MLLPMSNNPETKTDWDDFGLKVSEHKTCEILQVFTEGHLLVEIKRKPADIFQTAKRQT